MHLSLIHWYTLAGGVPQRRGQERHPARAGAGRGLRRVQQAGRAQDARGVVLSGAGGAGTAARQLGSGDGWPVDGLLVLARVGDGNRCAGRLQERPG